MGTLGLTIRNSGNPLPVVSRFVPLAHLLFNARLCPICFFVIPLKRLSFAPTVPPAVQQIEIHPYLTQAGNAAYCLKHNIAVTAYSPLGHAHDGGPMNDEVVIGIASKHGCSAAQVELLGGRPWPRALPVTHT